MEARDEKRLPRLRRDLAAVKLLIVDELGYVPLSPTGAELLFEVFSQRYERGSTIVTSNLLFKEWTSVFGANRLTGALLDRLTHHVHILSMNGENYRLVQSAIRISMDGRGRWMDNVFIERLWRSLKYEYVFLNAFETDSEAYAGSGAGSATIMLLHTAHLSMSLMQMDLGLDFVVLRGVERRLRARSTRRCAGIGLEARAFE
jgi:transposase InsO family protein